MIQYSDEEGPPGDDQYTHGRQGRRQEFIQGPCRTAAAVPLRIPVSSSAHVDSGTPTAAGPPADTPVPPAVIPAAKWTYAQAATTPALERATHIYMQRGGVGTHCWRTNYAGPYMVLEKGPKVFKLQLGERTKVVSRDRLKPHVGQALPAPAEPPRRGDPVGEVQDLPEDSEDLRGVL